MIKFDGHGHGDGTCKQAFATSSVSESTWLQRDLFAPEIIGTYVNMYSYKGTYLQGTIYIRMKAKMTFCLIFVAP